MIRRSIFLLVLGASVGMLSTTASAATNRLPNPADFDVGSEAYLEVARRGWNNGLDAPIAYAKFYSESPVGRGEIRIHNADHCRGSTIDTNRFAPTTFEIYRSVNINLNGISTEIRTGTPIATYTALDIVGNTSFCQQGSNDFVFNYDLGDVGGLPSSQSTAPGREGVFVGFIVARHTGAASCSSAGGSCPGGGGVNAFQLLSPDVTTSFGYWDAGYNSFVDDEPADEFGAFAVQDRIRPPDSFSNYTIQFAAPCDLTQDSVDIYLKWFDDDWGGIQTRSDYTFDLIEYDPSGARTANTVTVSPRGGDNAYSFERVTIRRDHKYDWRWNNVYNRNGIQIYMPFDSFTASDRNSCVSPPDITCDLIAQPGNSGVVGGSIDLNIRPNPSLPAGVTLTGFEWDFNNDLVPDFSRATSDINDSVYRFSPLTSGNNQFSGRITGEYRGRPIAGDWCQTSVPTDSLGCSVSIVPSPTITIDAGVDVTISFLLTPASANPSDYTANVIVSGLNYRGDFTGITFDSSRTATIVIPRGDGVATGLADPGIYEVQMSVVPVADPTLSSADCDRTFKLVRQPYLRAYGGDVLARGCDTDNSSNYASVNGQIIGIEPTNQSLYTNRTAGAYALLASGGITNVLARTSDRTTTSGELSLNDFTNGLPHDSCGASSITELDALNNGERSVTSDENTSIGGALAGYDLSNYEEKLTLFIEGDLFIDQDVVFQEDWRTIDEIPSLYVAVNGNIFIAPWVTRIDGVYIAEERTGGFPDYASSLQPRERQDAEEGGVIYTCAVPGNHDRGGSIVLPATVNPDEFYDFDAFTQLVTAANFRADLALLQENQAAAQLKGEECETTFARSLQVNGALEARRIHFDRLDGNIINGLLDERPGPPQAETVIFNPAIYMSTPFGGTNGNFNSLYNLPPLL